MFLLCYIPSFPFFFFNSKICISPFTAAAAIVRWTKYTSMTKKKKFFFFFFQFCLQNEEQCLVRQMAFLFLLQGQRTKVVSSTDDIFSDGAIVKNKRCVLKEQSIIFPIPQTDQKPSRTNDQMGFFYSKLNKRDYTLSRNVL